jgi:hypothetical protein
MKNLFINKILRNPNTIRLFLILIIFFGIFFYSKFYLAGVLLFFCSIFLVFEMLNISVNLHNYLDEELLVKQKILFFFFIIINTLLVDYTLQSINYDPINWEPAYFSYGKYNSDDYPSTGWFSGKREGKLTLDSFTDALGFGFPDGIKNDPFLWELDKNKTFILKYKLSKSLLIGAVFEDSHDRNLTETKIFLLNDSMEEKVLPLPLKEFNWKASRKIKHLKFNYQKLTKYDFTLVRFLLWIGCDSTVQRHYLRAI